jgi:Protein of unknown function (DUF2815)
MPVIQTAVGTLSGPHLFDPIERAKGSPDPIYSAVLLFQAEQVKSRAYHALLEAVEDIARASFPKGVLGKSIVSPFHDTHEKDNLPPGYDVFISAWSKRKPGVVDHARNDILDSDKVWPGQRARFAVYPFSWKNSGRRGVSLGLHHVQIVRSRGLKRLDGRVPAKEAFDDEYG